MIFVNFWIVGILGFCFVSIAVAVIVWRAARTKESDIGEVLRIGSIVLGTAAPLVLFFIGCRQIAFPNTASDPIYSPDRKQAVRVETVDLGATGGNTDVILYTNHGFHADRIAAGEWQVIQAKDIQWLQDNELRMSYDQSSAYGLHCTSARSVQVTCIPLPSPK